MVEGRTGYHTHRQRRQYVLWLLLMGVLLILAVEGFRPENRELVRQFWESTSVPGTEAEELGELTEVAPLPGLDRSLLEAVEDRTPLFSKEGPAVNQVVQLLRDTPKETLTRHCVGRVLYAQYMQQPGSYRGSLISLKGAAVRVVPEKVRDKTMGVETLYAVWILPEDNPSEPVVVYCVSLPEKFPRGEEVREKVRFTAMFFKVWPYASNSGVRSTALFYAKSPDWSGIPSDTFAQTRPQTFPFWATFLIGLAFGIGILLFINARVRSEQGPREELPDVMDLP
ncbi:MAG: hypothetical protein Q4D98_12270 [Planctomycetia bacterium]|nr:hypothetical protein [Planctomycetia bacterium]